MKPDVEILNTIVMYCSEMAKDVQRFGADEEDFLEDRAYQKCVAFTIVLIGEQVKRLSKELTSKYNWVEWSHIARARDFMSHDYERMIPSILWRTMVDDIPRLKNNCLQIIADIESGRVTVVDDELNS